MRSWTAAGSAAIYMVLTLIVGSSLGRTLAGSTAAPQAS
jgi:hypothetical protein